VGHTYTVAARQLTRANLPGSTPPSVSIAHDAIENLTLNAGSGDDTFLVTGTAFLTDTFLGGGDGNDTYLVGNNGVLHGLQYVPRLHGQGGTNTVLLDDSQHAVSRTYLWSGDVFRRDGIDSVLISNLSVAVRTGTGDDTIRYTGGVENPLRLQDAGGTDTLFG